MPLSASTSGILNINGLPASGELIPQFNKDRPPVGGEISGGKGGVGANGPAVIKEVAAAGGVAALNGPLGDGGAISGPGESSRGARQHGAG